MAMALTSGAATTGRAGGRPWPGDDFAGWLPPMLVKELRQGLQSGLFLWALVALQAVMVALIGYEVLLRQLAAAADPSRVAVYSSQFTLGFWLVAGAVIALIVPLRGLAAIDRERAGNTLELLQISRLSATRIVLGKWASLVAQAALAAVTLLPYIVLRYFHGGVDVVAGLEGLGWLLAVAAVVAAGAIALSTLPLWLRIGGGLCGGGLVALAWDVDAPLIASVAPRIGAVVVLDAAVRGGLLAVLAAHAAAFLEFAAARIAPPAENHAARKRLLAMMLAAAWPVAGWAGTLPAAVATFVATAPLLVCYVVGATVERPSRLRAVFAGFRRAGPLGRLAAAVFAPGWAAGLVFVAVVLGACAVGWLGFHERFPRAVGSGYYLIWPFAIASASLVAAALVCPAPFVALVPRIRFPLLVYGLVQILCFLPFVFADAFRPMTMPWGQYAAGQNVTLPFPASAIAAFAAITSTFDWDARSASARHAAFLDEMETDFTFTLAGLAVIGTVLVVLAWPWCREIVAADRLVRGAIPATPRPAVRATVRRRPAAAVGPWVWRGDDFSGWLPAMVVRELRQGLQSGVFAWTFIGIQAAMFAAAAWTLLALGPDRPWWFLIGAAAIAGVIPLRGLTAVSGERAGNNLDLVRLTRLSATRIVLGKWLAIVAQGLLVAAALLPYIVLRYFFGRVNVFVELEMLGWLVAWSMVVAAATLALSTLPLWLRCGGLAAVAFCCVPAFKTANWLGGRAHMGQLGVADRFLILAGLGLYTVALLEYAAARIAPPTENHAGRTRLLAVAIAVAWGGIALCAESPWDGMETIRFTLPLLLCYAIGALLEKPVASGGPYVPFGRFGVAGKAAAAVFTPGWATAAPFVALTAAVCVAGMMVLAWRWPVSGQNACRAFLNLGCLAVATLVFPLPILVWLPRARLRPLLYALVQVACFLVFVYLTTVAPRDYTQAAHWSGWLLALPFPLAALAAYVRLDGDLAEAFGPAFLVAALLVTAVVLALVARPWLREMREVMRRVAGRDGT